MASSPTLYLNDMVQVILLPKIKPFYCLGESFG